MSGFAAGILQACYSVDIPALEQELRTLQKEGRDLRQQFCILQHRTDSIWDALAVTLEQKMPSSIPPTDQKVFIQSRNADHIRMFMSFKTLPPDLQMLVHKSGTADSLLAIQVRALQNQMSAYETQKAAFLTKITSTDEALGRRFSDSLRTASNQPCP